MEKNGKKEVFSNFDNLNKDISVFRKDLNKINEDKEEWFKKKEELKKEVLSLIKEVKKLRESKEKSNKKIKELKKEREKYNKEVQENISKVKSREPNKFKDKQLSLGVIKSNIAKLEMTVETEVLSMGNEKKLMKEINKLKKEYDSRKGSEEENSKVSGNITESRAKAEDFHKKIQILAKESQKDYEKLNELSNKIKELNKKQEAAFDNFLKLKNQFNVKSKGLEDKLKKIGEAKKKTDNKKGRNEKKRMHRNEKLINDKVKNVEEKLKKGSKLTKEDLLVFQGK